jgi:hypothetical protein
MTNEAPPEHLYALSPVDDRDALTKAIHRLAQAVEQNTLALFDQRIPVTTPPAAPVFAPLPPVQTQVAPPPPAVVQPATIPVPPMPSGVCPVHNQPWSKFVPAGTSRKTGEPYTAFWACPTTRCDQRPPR